jgi:hypothetical protein
MASQQEDGLGGPSGYSLNQVRDAANADDVLDVVEKDELTTDLVNLLVNVVLHYVEYPDHGLSDAIEACYSEDVETVLGWVGG